jgi:hypothetical protein
MGQKRVGGYAMTRVLNILVEGETEKEFVNNLIYPHLLAADISNIRPITIETSPGFKGGDVRYHARYKPNIISLLYGKEDMIVTSLIDFYKLRNDFPGFAESKEIKDINNRVKFLEDSCFKDVNDNRFIPYIQLHEFEGLLFTDFKGFDLFSDLPDSNKKELMKIVNDFPNPELINEGSNTAPSVRLKNLIPRYQKPLFGNMIALENGFEVILEKCPRFKAWIENLIFRMKA